MEGLLVILVSAISLSLFLQQQKEGGNPSVVSRFFHWDTWASQEGFSFTPSTAESAMNIVADIAPYTVYIYAKPKQHELDAPREEQFYTEIRVPLRYTLASGLWIQSRKGLERIRLTKTAKLLEFKRGNMDELFFAEAKDHLTGQWVMGEPGYRDVLDLLKELPPKSHIEQRILVWACDSVDIAEVASEMAKALQAANNLDMESVKIWRKWQEELNWTLQRQHGYPMLWGRHHGIRMQVSVPDTQRPSIEFIAEFPETFPEDLALWGIEYLKEGSGMPQIANDWVWLETGEHPLSLDLRDNQKVLRSLEVFFKERPRSKLFKRTLRIEFPGKQNVLLDKHMKMWLQMCLDLQTHFSPPEPEIDVVEVLNGVSR